MKQVTIEEALKAFVTGKTIQCIVPEMSCEEGFEICDEWDSEYTFNHYINNGAVIINDSMILHGKWYVVD